MRVVWTEAALADLEEVLAYIAEHYPALAVPVERRLRAVIERVARWPQSGRAVDQRPGVRVVPLVRFPYRLFYVVTDDVVEVLHVHHAARDD